jgi:hypothetical protein
MRLLWRGEYTARGYLQTAVTIHLGGIAHKAFLPDLRNRPGSAKRRVRITPPPYISNHDDALAAATAAHHRHTLLTADRRAAPVYQALGVSVTYVGEP